MLVYSKGIVYCATLLLILKVRGLAAAVFHLKIINVLPKYNSCSQSWPYASL